jgi:phenylpyruvate tautomerase PptA (4-oxalocrotonate tautomerase family)
MPTYTVTNSNFTLKSEQKNDIAKGITKIHSRVTGANTYFAQVIFNQIKNNDHFLGGKKVKEQQIFLFGQIRAGRSSKIKKKLILELRDVIIKKTKLDISQVWVYIVDLTPSQMIEYGAILPESGKETKWFNNLSPKLKKKLLALEA